MADIGTAAYTIDRGPKLIAYRRNGMREYIIWRVEDRAIDWFILRGDRYELLPVDTNGIIKSETFPGLWLDTAAIIADDVAPSSRC